MTNPPAQPGRQPLRIAVIGGGFSGLAAAHRLTELTGRPASPPVHRPVDVVLFEAAEHSGGVTGTVREDDWLIETGADSFITNKPQAVDLCRRLGIEDQLIPTDDRFRRSLVLRKGRPLPVPEGFMLMAPARIGPILRTRVLSPWGKLRMGLEYLLPRGATGSDESLAAFVRRRFGREVFERLVQPLVGGIYTADPELLSLRATLPRFLDMEQQHGSLIRATLRQQAARNSAGRRTSREDSAGSGARYGLFATPAGGVSSISRALTDRLRETAELRFACRVTGLQRPASSTEHDTSWELELSTGSREQFDAVLLALPAWQAARLVDGASPELASQLEQIPYASSAIVVTGHRLADIQHPLDAFGLVIPAIEHRRVLAVSFASRKFPGRAPEGHVLLRTFVGGALQPELLQHSDDELSRLVAEELHALLGVAGPPILQHIARYQQAMPQYHVGHVEKVARIMSLADALPGLALAGNAYTGVGIPDCIGSGERAAEQLLSRLRPGT